MRPLLVSCLAVALSVLPSWAEEDDHAHVAKAEGLRVLHAWARATQGPDAYVFAEIENAGPAARTLTGAEAEAAGASALVGFGITDGVAGWTVLPGVPVASGADLHLEPDVLAIRLEGLTAPLVEGDNLALHFVFDGLDIAVEAEIGAADARAHSHAGHLHP
jgi:hypothetical protein